MKARSKKYLTSYYIQRRQSSRVELYTKKYRDYLVNYIKDKEKEGSKGVGAVGMRAESAGKDSNRIRKWGRRHGTGGGK